MKYPITRIQHHFPKKDNLTQHKKFHTSQNYQKQIVFLIQYTAHINILKFYQKSSFNNHHPQFPVYLNNKVFIAELILSLIIHTLSKNLDNSYCDMQYEHLSITEDTKFTYGCLFGSNCLVWLLSHWHILHISFYSY